MQASISPRASRPDRFWMSATTRSKSSPPVRSRSCICLTSALHTSVPETVVKTPSFLPARSATDVAGSSARTMIRLRSVL